MIYANKMMRDYRMIESIFGYGATYMTVVDLGKGKREVDHMRNLSIYSW